MRYRLPTLLLLVVPIAMGLAWWKDHAHLASQLDLTTRQVRQLQEQIDRRSFFGIASNIRFKTPEELVEFVQKATDNEFAREDWSAWGNSPVAEQSVGPLTKLLRSDSEDARHHAAWLLGWVGHSKRPLPADPVPALVATLDDPSWRVRAETTTALGRFGRLAQDALPVLRRMMRRDQSLDAYLATMTVKEIDPAEDIGPRLRELFLDGDKGVWKNVAFRLPDHLPAAEAKQLLMAKSEHETDSESREILAQAMNKIKD